jgi:hypothetical protein
VAELLRIGTLVIHTLRLESTQSSAFTIEERFQHVSMLTPCFPLHPNSGYCNIQGRQRTIEDFHSIHLHPTHKFYGILDGHTGNLASKYAAATAYKKVSKHLSSLEEHVVDAETCRDDVQQNLTNAFRNIHDNFLKAVSFSPAGVMDQSGTTATIVYVTVSADVVASVGDSRAIMSSNQRQQDDSVVMSAVPWTTLPPIRGRKSSWNNEEELSHQVDCLA